MRKYDIKVLSSKNLKNTFWDWTEGKSNTNKTGLSGRSNTYTPPDKASHECYCTREWAIAFLTAKEKNLQKEFIEKLKSSIKYLRDNPTYSDHLKSRFGNNYIKMAIKFTKRGMAKEYREKREKLYAPLKNFVLWV